MSKVYLVVTEQGSWDDYMWNIHCICSTKEKAEEKEKDLRRKINAIKNKYKTKINTPWVSKGDISHSDYIIMNYTPEGKKPEDYPDVYEPVYKLEDGTEICLGEPIWRSKNYEIRSTNFNHIHISQNTPIFGTRENCEKWLETNAKNIRTELLKQNSNSSFQTLKSLVKKLDNMEELSWSDLYKIREGLNNCISNIENI